MFLLIVSDLSNTLGHFGHVTAMSPFKIILILIKHIVWLNICTVKTCFVIYHRVVSRNQYLKADNLRHVYSLKGFFVYTSVHKFKVTIMACSYKETRPPSDVRPQKLVALTTIHLSMQRRVSRRAAAMRILVR